MGVPENHRSPRTDQVDIALAVHVGQVGPRTGGHEYRRPSDRAERPHRGIHSAWRYRPRPRVQVRFRRPLGSMIGGGTTPRTPRAFGKFGLGSHQAISSHASARTSSSRNASGSGWLSGSDSHLAADPLLSLDGGATT